MEGYYSNNMQNNTQVPVKDIAANYFVRMMLPDAEKNAEPYVNEEKTALMNLISDIDNLDDINFVVIGAGTLWYVEMVLGKVKQYIAVEPYADIFIQKQLSYILGFHKDIKVISNEFGDFDKDQIGNGNSIFVFHFNILSYIPDPVKNINKYLKPGDVLYISSWSDSLKAQAVRKTYFDYLNLEQKDGSFTIDPASPVGLYDLDSFPFSELSSYNSHQRIKGAIVDILIIHC